MAALPACALFAQRSRTPARPLCRYANDTAALREVAPSASVHLDSGAAATIDALVAMSRSDLLVMGTSGFSTWSAIFSCGVKIGVHALSLYLFVIR